jgi:hypothetical protein
MAGIIYGARLAGEALLLSKTTIRNNTPSGRSMMPHSCFNGKNYLWGQVSGRSLAPVKNNDKEQHTKWEVNDAPLML